MGKLKTSICPECLKNIGRHDGNRERLLVALPSSGGKMYRDFHLSCTQKLRSEGKL